MKSHKEKLFLMAKKGNIEAFEKLAEPYYKKVYGLALMAEKDMKKASDLSQKVFINAFKQIKNMETEKMFSLSIYKTAKEIIYG